MNVSYCMNASSYTTFDTKNLYAYVYERGKSLLHNLSIISMIVQISSISTLTMKSMRNELIKNSDKLWISN